MSTPNQLLKENLGNSIEKPRKREFG